jgi:hypothetical protein
MALDFQEQTIAQLAQEIVSMMQDIEQPIDIKIAALNSAANILQQAVMRMSLLAAMNNIHK